MIWLRPVRFAVVALADAGALVALAPDWVALGRHLASANDWVARDGADEAIASLTGAALWLAALWLGLLIAVLLLATVPGWLGQTGRRLVTMIAPAAVSRLLAGVAGISIGLAVIAPIASASVGSGVAAPIGASALRSPGWPLTSQQPTGRTQPTAPIGPIAPAGPAGPAGVHTVVPGDCLWNLAAAQLRHNAQPDERQIAAQTAAWYVANRGVIGPDPSVLHPGQQLVEPGRTQ